MRGAVDEFGFSKLERLIDRDIAKLGRLVNKYCRKEKKEKASEWVNFAGEYAFDFPQKADIEEAVSLVAKAEKYMTAEGKPFFAEVRARMVKNLWKLLDEEKSSADN